MKKYIVVLSLFFLALTGCGGSGSSGGGSTTYGTLAFSQTAVLVPEGSSKSVTLTLSGSSNVTNLIATLSSSESSVATISPSQCTFSSNNSTTCQLNITALSNGTTQISVSASDGSYAYQVTPINVAVSSSLNFSTTVQGVGETIYSGRSYPATFVFTNNGTSSANLGKTAISMPSPIQWQLTSDSCSNTTVASGATCSISGSISMLNPQTSATLSFTLEDNNSNSYYYEMREYSVLFKSGYAPIHINTPAGSDGQTGAYLLGEVGGVSSDPGSHPIQYTAAGNNVYMGTIINPSSTGGAPSTYTFQLPVGDTVLYTPPMLVGVGSLSNAGGRMYISYGGALNGVAGGMPDTTQNVPFVLTEFNVTASLITYIDVSYVDSVGVPISVTGVQDDGSVATNTSAGVKAQYYALSGTTILNNIKNALSAFSGTWNLSAYLQMASGTDNLIAILSPSIVFESSTTMPTGFNASIFNDYFNDVWNNYYAKGHSFLINATEVSSNLAGGSNCVLSGSVIGSNMVFSPTAGSTCPTGAYTTPGGAFVTGPSTFSIPVADLGYYAFFSGFANQSIYGANGTYQSLSKYLASAWTVGFLPFCGHDDIEYTTGALSSYSSELFTPQYTCLPGYGSAYSNNVLNQYDNEVHTYFDAYGYAYDDATGISATFQTNSKTYPATIHVLKYNN